MRAHPTRLVTAAGLVLSLAFAAVQPVTAQNVRITGSGASFPFPLYSAWFQEFGRLNRGTRIDYQSTGSGAGVQALIQRTVDFAASDLAMTDEQIAQVNGGVVILPMTAGTIVLAYNLPGATELKLPLAEAERSGGKAVAVAGDVSRESDVIAMFEATTKALGPLDGVVVNAGVAATSSRLVDMSVERMRQVFEVNVLGAYLVAREAARRMNKSRGGNGGSIVLISSVAARIGAPDTYVDYAGSKAAVDAMALGLSKELGREGVRVNSIRPGVIETEIHAAYGEPERPYKIGASTPLGRPGTRERNRGGDRLAAERRFLLCHGRDHRRDRRALTDMIEAQELGDGAAVVAPILEIRGVAKRFDATQALEDVSLALHAGEIHALLGENGAGKSTLIKIITGVHQPDRGQILLAGRAGHDTQRRRGAATGRRGHLSRTAAVSRSQCRREHFHQPPGPRRRGRLASRCFAKPKNPRRTWRGAGRAKPGARTDAGRPAVGRNRQGDFAERSRPHHGRADRVAVRT